MGKMLCWCCHLEQISIMEEDMYATIKVSSLPDTSWKNSSVRNMNILRRRKEGTGECHPKIKV